MSGTELKQILNAAGVNFTQVARMLGMSQQNFYNLFVAQDVKSGTLERISTAIGRDMSMFYPLPTQAATVTGDNSTAVAGNGNQVNAGKLIDEVAAQRRLTEAALVQNDKLIAIIETITKK